MANKLFYTVTKDNANNFKAENATNPVIGFVAPDASEDFGYILVGGNQYGASYSDIEMIAAAKADDAYTTAKDYADNTFAKAGEVSGKFTEVNNKFNDYALKTEVVNTTGSGSFMADGVEYTVKVEGGVLSVVQYIKPTIDTVSFTPGVTASIDNSGKTVEYYVGESYNIAYSMTVPTEGQVHIKVYNPTGGNFDVKFNDGTGQQILHKSLFTQTEGTSYWTCAYAWTKYPTSVGTGSITGTVNYAANSAKLKQTNKVSVDFNIVNPEKTGEVASTKNGSIQYSISTTVSCQYPYYIGETLPNGEITTSNAGWVVKQHGERPSSMTVPAGKTYYLVIPTAVGTPKFDNAGFGVTPKETDLTINTINGKTLSGNKTYKAYEVAATSGEVKLNIKW